MLTCAPVSAAEGGPDIAGYTWADIASGGAAFNYEFGSTATLAPLGTRPTQASDDAMGTVSIGFDFPFYGETYSDIDIHSNGGLTFGATAFLIHQHNCATLSFEAPTILPYWIDLFPGTGSNGGVYYWMAGTSPNRYFVVEWYQIALWREGGDYSQSDKLTFETKLFEDGRIEFHFEDLDGDNDNDNGAEAAVLIAGTNPGTNDSSVLMVSCDNNTTLFSGNAISFSPPSCADADGDGMGSCEGDCDDTAATVFLGAPELCDGLDNDCDLVLPSDEVDLDQDGEMICEGDCDDDDEDLNLDDEDGDGFNTCTGDCDDNDDNATPSDKHGDGQSGCEGDCDDSDPNLSDADADNDGLSGCEGHCDDHNNTVRPGNGELCDGRDNDCDGDIDENPNCDGRGDGGGVGHDIPYGCIVSCGLESEHAPVGALALFVFLVGLHGLSRRRRTER